MSVVRLVPLTLGWQELDRSVALDGHPPGTTDRIPIPGWLLEKGDGTLVLFDAWDPLETPERMAVHQPTLLGSATPFFRAYVAGQRRHGTRRRQRPD